MHGEWRIQPLVNRVARKDQLVPLLIIAIFCMLRLFRLGDQGLFLDEAWSWFKAQSSLPQIVFSSNEPNPPFYFILLKAILAFVPSTEMGLRMPSALCSMASLIAILVFVKRGWGGRAAVGAGWFMILSSFDVYYAQDARFYSLLALLWLLSYVALCEALQGRPRYFLVWGIACVALAWTHFYGLLVVSIQLAFVILAGGWQSLHRRPSLFPVRWALTGTILAIVGSSPMFLLFGSLRNVNAGGAWIPGYQDLFVLFSLSNVGLASARTYFLDSAHLVLFPFQVVPIWGWALVGVALCGGLALRGMWQEWRSATEHRWSALLGCVNIVMPVAVVFAYGFVFHQAVWALKPFLATAYLFYLWGGIGLARLPFPLLRPIVFVLILLVSAISLVPYYSTWQKTDIAAAFRALPTFNERHVILMEPAFMAPLSFYYLGEAVPVWGISTDQSKISLVRTLPADIEEFKYEPIDCSAPSLQEVTGVWAYSSLGRVRDRKELWPTCLLDKELWVFESHKWTRLDH